MRFCLSLLVLSSVAVLSSCSTEKKADAAQPRERKAGSVAPRRSVVETPSGPYRPGPVTAGARLTGTVDFEGAMPLDSTISLSPETQGCGSSMTIRSIQRTGTKIGGAVVWLADIRAGKPLPMERRFELANNECLLVPSVQAVFAPATLNMASEDVVMHHNHIVDVATGELQAIAPFNDNGEVIPFDALLTKPAQLEVTCQLHPWAKAWILVFDHPYFAVSDRSGAFSITDVPAGTYRVKAWHPHLGISESTVTVSGGQPASLGLKLSGAASSSVPVAAQPPSAE